MTAYPARCGYSNGTGMPGTYYEMDGSGKPGGLLGHDGCEHLFEIRNVDIDADTNNDGKLDQSWDEEVAEDGDGRPGVLVPVNDDDTDRDGIRDFADMFIDSANNPEHFAPVVLRLPAYTDPSQIRFKISYDASDPSAVQRSGDGSPRYPFVDDLPETGMLRLWTQDGNKQRSVVNFDDAPDSGSSIGYFVAPTQGDEFYTASDWNELVRLTGGSSGAREVKLWVEAVKASTYLVRLSHFSRLIRNCRMSL